MKKRIKIMIGILTVAVTIISLCACGKNSGTVSDGTTNSADGNKVILILVDGMRPDGFEGCGNSFTEELKKNSAYTLNARTAFPSKTLPCHLSLFYSVSPETHGTTTNTFTPKNDNLEGLFERLDAAQKKSCIYYNWEPLRDIAHPKAVTAAEYIRMGDVEDADSVVTEMALDGIKKYSPDFVFVYLGKTDDVGHSFGWMSQEYLDCINDTMNDVKTIIDKTKGKYTVILTADHGGHDKTHGFDNDEDMTIPMFVYGEKIEKGNLPEGVTILDIAPTILDIMDVNKPEKWEGKSFAADIMK